MPHVIRVWCEGWADYFLITDSYILRLPDMSGPEAER